MEHILLISFLYEPALGGGASTVVYTLCNELKHRGYQVSVLTSSAGKKLEIENLTGIQVFRLPSKNLYWISDKDKKSTIEKAVWQSIDTWNPFVFKQVKEIIARIQPDLIHVHKLRGLSPSLWSAAHACGVPVVHTCHDYELISPQGTLSGRLGEMALNRSIFLRPYQAIRRRASNSVNTFTAPSQGLLDTHLAFDFFPNATHHVIPNTHGKTKDDLAKIMRQTSIDSSNQPLRLLYMGRIHPEKGVEDLLKAFVAVFDQNKNIYLDVAGDGPILQELKKVYGIHPAIHFYGNVTGELKECLFSQSDILVLPSRCREGLPIVISEAFSYGKPVLATKTGGPQEMIIQGDTGFLLSPNNILELKNNILNISTNRNAIAGMRSKCFEAARIYSVENVLGAYTQLYQKAIEENV